MDFKIVVRKNIAKKMIFHCTSIHCKRNYENFQTGILFQGLEWENIQYKTGNSDEVVMVQTNLTYVVL